ncbi:MAG: bifunctional phosphopantothenoylcysteine decarboxylase/phosphopantothenate--cysteine ligase CoaBC [Flavobacteriaceae bacterium]|nr:bifunctional phosphopantothenoylcysteine decarboxylase/phosphopantothenate--cysteine ligase CoaBC [Flavobacteriaceae bacterium]|tara:strand:- start:20288 stop:21502 length:1215 start_codon:yes stop_codon:yes gene_type:complete
MSVLSGKKILLGITAGIAAYKSAFLVRLLIKKGAEVRVVVTPAAKDFVTPLTLSTLSKNEVWSEFTNEEEGDGAVWNNHVELGGWADLFLIAPATANTMSKMASGASDNLLLATYLSAKCPVYYAPAMDLDMYEHPSTQQSFTTLDSYGNIQIPAEHGELASGLVGKGRMAEPESIVTFLETDLLSKLPLQNKRILITAGPTYEAIDPVRFIGNHSSGKMGYALATAAAQLGAEVVLVSGPTQLTLEHDRVSVIRVVSAAAMYAAVHDHKEGCDIAILSAAVADFRPKTIASEKIKKKGAEMQLELERTQDILASLGAEKGAMLLVGFAMETEDGIANAKSKLKKKNLDLIVLNSLKDKGAGFQGDTNKVTLIDVHNNVVPFEVKPKIDVANDIFQYILEHFYA